METLSKYDKILDALEELLKSKEIKKISVSDIAKTAGIGKGSIYYYFSSKDAIVDSLIERNYKKPLETAKELAAQVDLSPFDRMSMIFQACQSSSKQFLQQKRTIICDDSTAKDVKKTPPFTDSTIKREKKAPNAANLNIPENAQEQAYIHQKYLKYIISELKPTLTQIIKQGIAADMIHFPYPEQLAEIVLIVLTVKLDNTLDSSSQEEIEKTIRALILLLEKGVSFPSGALDYLTTFQTN